MPHFGFDGPFQVISSPGAFALDFGLDGGGEGEEPPDPPDPPPAEVAARIAYYAINLQDLAEIYAQVGQMPGRQNSPRRNVQSVVIPGRAGGVITDILSGGPRELTLTGVVFATSREVEDREEAEDSLKDIAYHSRVSVRATSGFGDLREIEGYLISLTCDPRGPSLLSPSAQFALTMSCPDGFWRDVLPRAYALTGTAKQIPLGTAPSSPRIRLMGAATPVVDPTVTVRDLSGAVVNTVTFDISLSDDDFIDHDCNTGITTKSIDGVVSVDNSLSDGDLMFALQPRNGSRVADTWGTVELSAGSGTPTGLIMYRRMWL